MIEIPKNLRNKIGKSNNVNLKAYVYSLLRKYNTLLQSSHFEFFPEYTDHGSKHIKDILLTVDRIIDKESMEYLKDIDVVLLIHSILIHDIGMVITPGMFQSLIAENGILFKDIDKKSWSQLWSEYLGEARKFDEKTQKKIFGLNYSGFKDPNFDNLNNEDRLLIGEFIRRHHPRLGHEIAENGMILNDDSTQIEAYLDGNFKFISGLIARSHGMNLRDTFPILKSRYYDAWKTPFDCRVIYLMAIIRIADYLQIQANRAPRIPMLLKNFRSDFSRNEWLLHNCVEHVNYDVDDPEKIYVQCNPKSSITYLKIRRLLTAIQNELDKTWAVLGEVYGAKKYSALGIGYRRITSALSSK